MCVLTLKWMKHSEPTTIDNNGSQASWFLCFVTLPSDSRKLGPRVQFCYCWNAKLSFIWKEYDLGSYCSNPAGFLLRTYTTLFLVMEEVMQGTLGYVYVWWLWKSTIHPPSIPCESSRLIKRIYFAILSRLWGVACSPITATRASPRLCGALSRILILGSFSRKERLPNVFQYRFGWIWNGVERKVGEFV